MSAPMNADTTSHLTPGRTIPTEKDSPCSAC
jgi:hypothetical protein